MTENMLLCCGAYLGMERKRFSRLLEMIFTSLSLVGYMQVAGFAQGKKTQEGKFSGSPARVSPEKVKSERKFVHIAGRTVELATISVPVSEKHRC